MGCYDIGDLVRLSAEFTDAVGAYHDPTAVYCRYSDPSGNETTLQYGVDVALVRDSEGHYHVDVAIDEAGRWPYRWYATGTGQSAGTARLVVRNNAR